jgi:hypothetical protein
VPTFASASRVAVLVIQSEICCTELSGAIPKPSAATPATCGDAIDVPEMVFVAVVEVYHADRMLEPGAKTSRQDPKLENDERASAEVVEPTVTASGSPAGEVWQALALLFPAATTKTTPSRTPFCTAISSAEDRPPPRLMLATAGVPAT